MLSVPKQGNCSLRDRRRKARERERGFRIFPSPLPPPLFTSATQARGTEGLGTRMGWEIEKSAFTLKLTNTNIPTLPYSVIGFALCFDCSKMARSLTTEIPPFKTSRIKKKPVHEGFRCYNYHSLSSVCTTMVSGECPTLPCSCTA